MRIGVNLFLALMFTVIGVVYLPIIEKPLEIYYDGDVTHTSTHFSYEPGESGTSYDFFLERPDRGYDRIGFFPSVALPTFFYFGLFTLLGLVRRMVYKRKPFDENHPYLRNNPPKEKFLAFQQKQQSQNKRTLIPLATVLFVALFFMSGHYHLFGLGNPYASDSENAVESVETQHFQPNFIRYTPNQKGTGKLWLIQEDRTAEGATFIEDESTKPFDSIIYTINIFDQESGKNEKFDQFILSNETNNFDPFISGNEIWIIARPTILRIYDTDSKELICGDISDFTKKRELLKSGIHTFYRTDANENIIRMETMDGGLYYYSVAEDSLYESLWKRNSEKKEIFQLRHGNGDRFHLSVKTTGYNSISFEDEFYIKGNLIYQNDSICVIHHWETVAEDSEKRITCVDKENKPLWTVKSKDFPHREPGEYEPTVVMMEYKTQRDGNLLIIEFNNSWMNQTQGIMAIDLASGKVKWKYNYEDLCL